MPQPGKQCLSIGLAARAALCGYLDRPVAGLQVSLGIGITDPDPSRAGAKVEGKAVQRILKIEVHAPRGAAEGRAPRQIDVFLTPEVRVGDYVSLRNGYATTIISKPEALEILELIEEIFRPDSN